MTESDLLQALANSGGGTVFLGVADGGSIAGLDALDVRRLNLLVSNAASQQAGRAYVARGNGNVNGPV